MGEKQDVPGMSHESAARLLNRRGASMEGSMMAFGALTLDSISLFA